MQNCLECLSPTSADCVVFEEELSFKHNEKLVDIIKTMDERISKLEALLTTNVESKWADDHEYVTEYIQDIINKLDVTSSSPSSKYTINSALLGEGEKSLLQILTVLVKNADAQQNINKNKTSSLYLGNV